MSAVWWKTLVALVCAGALLQLAVCPAAAAPQVSSFSLPGNQPSGVTARFRPSGTPDLSKPVTLAIGLKLPNPEGLRAAAAAAKSGRVAALTAQQFLDEYAPTAGDYQAVVSWLTDQGFSVQTSPNRLLVFATGSLGQSASTFKVTLANYNLDDRICYANTTAPQVPTALSGIIQSVAGLDNIDYFHTFSRQAKAGESPLTAGIPSVYSSVYQDVYGITPLGIRSAYDVEPVIDSGVDGTGQTIDIVIWNAIKKSDVDAFDTAYDLPALTTTPNQLNQIHVGGTPEIDYSDGSVEATLDVEMAHALAPGAAIDVYEAVDSYYSTIEEALNEAIVQDKANVLSMGWGSSEYSYYYGKLPQAFLATMDAIFAQGAAEGMTMLAASGDTGEWSVEDIDYNIYKGWDPALNTLSSIEYPASDPYVTGVGGTDLSITSDGAYNGETVWNDELGDGDSSGPFGSTGGFSDDFLAPSWQQPTVYASVSGSVYGYVYQGTPGINYNSNDSRGVPDVALNAAEDTALYIDGAGGAYGGTSIGAPCWAGMVALVDQALAAKNPPQPPLGYFNPLLYNLGQNNQTEYQSVFNQVYIGDNDTLYGTGPYYAAYGWNPATGWGTPDFEKLFDYLTGNTPSPPAPVPSITASPTALAPDYADGTLITISGVNTNFDRDDTTVSLVYDKENMVKTNSVDVISNTSLTFQLDIGLPQGEGNITVTDPTDGSMTASILIGTETAAISPNTLTAGYPDTQIDITGDNSYFTDGYVVVQVVNAATQAVVFGGDYATVTDTTHASFILPGFYDGLEAGQYDVVVNDAYTGVSMSIPLTINPNPHLSLIAHGASLPNGTVGTPYTSDAITEYVFASGGTTPYSFNVNGLPADLSFNNSNNEIAGIPTATPFSGNVTVTVTDSTTPTAQTANVALPLTVSSSSSPGPGDGGGGGVSSTSTATAPTVQTNDASAIGTTSAILNGSIIAGGNITEYGFLWGTDQDNLANKLQVSTGNHSGAFAATLGNLTAGTTYYFQAYAENASGTGDGTVISFTTTASQAPATPTTLPTPVTFSDVPVSDWAYNAIGNLYSQGYITGYPDGSFKPGNTITRAEFVSIIDRILNLPAYNPPAPDFKDVPSGSWFYGSVENAVYAGIVKGYDDSSFGPNDPITREELANILVNALGKQDEAGASMNAKTGFKDDALISSWARGSVVAAVKYDLLKGYPDGSFRPLGNATRAETCAMLMNYLGLNNR